MFRLNNPHNQPPPPTSALLSSSLGVSYVTLLKKTSLVQWIPHCRGVGSIMEWIKQDKAGFSGLTPILMNSLNVIVPSKQLEQDHAIIIRMNPKDAKRMRLVQSIYGYMYKDLDEILEQEKVLPSKLLENASHLVVYASVLEAIGASTAVTEFAWGEGWSKVKEKKLEARRR
ncbi:hypothetical protein LguiB_007628 [Lonicera macranthoides]